MEQGLKQGCTPPIQPLDPILGSNSGASPPATPLDTAKSSRKRLPTVEMSSSGWSRKEVHSRSSTFNQLLLKGTAHVVHRSCLLESMASSSSLRFLASRFSEGVSHDSAFLFANHLLATRFGSRTSPQCNFGVAHKVLLLSATPKKPFTRDVYCSKRLKC